MFYQTTEVKHLPVIIVLIIHFSTTINDGFKGIPAMFQPNLPQTG